MAGLLDGLAGLGLGNLEGADIFAEEKKETAKASAKVAAPVKTVEEIDLIYDKEYACPVCSKKFVAKIMKTSKAKLISNDADLRPRYEGIDAGKYDVLLCPKCGYAALGRYFPNILPAQVKLIKENISSKIKLNKYEDETYSYTQALERYKVALANAVVKKSKISEKAYICLKTAWLLRGEREELEANEVISTKIDSIARQEDEYLKNAYTGFIEARAKESFPIAGMDQTTLDYLLAQLSYRFGEYDNSMRLVGAILTSACSERIKDKARTLKDQINAAKKQ